MASSFFQSCKIQNLEAQINDNIIEKDLQSLLKPLNLIQNLFLCAKYKIKDGRIYPNTMLYKLVSSFGTAIILVINNYSVFDSLLWDIIYTFLVFLGFILNCYFCLAKSQDNVALILKIQHVLRAQRKATFFRQYSIYTWFCVVASQTFAVLTIVVYVFVLPELDLYELGRTYIVSCLDVNALYASILIKIVCESLKTWLEDVQRAEESEDENNDWDNIFHTFLEINEAYQLIVKTFQALVSWPLIS